MTNSRRGVAEGMPVFSVDGLRVGKVIGCAPAHFEIERGFFFPKDYLVAYDDVTTVEDGEVFLRRTRHELERAWARAELVGDDAGHEPPVTTSHGYQRNAASTASDRPGERLNTGAIVEEDEPVAPGDDDHPMMFEGRREVDDYLF